MALNINHFRLDKGGNPDIIRESQKRRFADEGLVDEVIKHDSVWRKLRGEKDKLNRLVNVMNKLNGMKYKSMGKIKDAEEKAKLMGKKTDEVPKEILDDVVEQVNKHKDKDSPIHKLNIQQTNKVKEQIIKLVEEKNAAMVESETKRNKALHKIGNIVSEKSVVSKTEDNNGLIRESGKCEKKKYNHVDLMNLLGAMDLEAGTAVAGNRGYFLLGDIVRLNYALIQYSLDFLQKREYCPIYTPFFMSKDLMKRVAQLEQFEEELYKVYEGKEGEEPKFLIATSEQTICGLHYKKRFDEKELPKRYAGISTNFRKEAGSHGRDTLGIFRIHQFEKVEQFCVTSPKDNKSWEMFDTMIKNAEDFWKSLGVPYRVVNIVSGKLNNAAALKYDLEGWFPGSGTFRELVSCSNCLDYQSRRLDTRFGLNKKNDDDQFVHMLNSTCCATQRSICCIIENYQTETGVNIPEVLQPYMGGKKFIPFTQKLKKEKKKGKKGKK